MKQFIILLSLTWIGSLAFGQEIIVDNQDPNTSSAGHWWPSSGKDPYLGESLYSGEFGSRFQWAPGVLEVGDYDVYAWWTYHPNRSNNVPYDIYTGNETLRVAVDQSDPNLGGRWNLLGRFTITTRFNINVIIRGENGQASADAVRFVKAAPPPEWPEVNCPCDEYYSRAVDKYLAWGGSMVPKRLGGATVSIQCDDPQDTLDLDAIYTTENNGDSVSLRLSIFTTPDVSFAECDVSVESSLVQNGRIYDKGINSTTPDWVEACRASVRDFCAADPAP